MEERFLEKTDFKNYKDFVNNYKINIPENFDENIAAGKNDTINLLIDDESNKSKK